MSGGYAARKEAADMTRPDPGKVETLAFSLWRMDVATTGLDAEDFPNWIELEQATRQVYRARAELRLLTAG